LIGYNLSDQIDTFVEVLPADSLHKADTVDQADTDLGADLGIEAERELEYG
jgi:hypothetical protein